MDLGLSQLPLYTGLMAAALMVLHLVLMGRVIATRGSAEVLIGDGGVDSLEQRIRVHGNFVENTPIFLIGLMLAEIVAGSTLVILGLGLAFVAGRIAHAVGYSMSVGVTKGRLIGTLVSMISTLATAGYLVYLIVARL